MKIQKRGLTRELVEEAASAPQQVVGTGRRKIAQNRYTDAGADYLVRVVFEEDGADTLIITAYRTSKVHKYWRSP